MLQRMLALGWAASTAAHTGAQPAARNCCGGKKEANPRSAGAVAPPDATTATRVGSRSVTRKMSRYYPSLLASQTMPSKICQFSFTMSHRFPHKPCVHIALSDSTKVSPGGYMKFKYTMGKAEPGKHSSFSACEFVSSPCRFAMTQPHKPFNSVEIAQSDSTKLSTVRHTEFG